MSTATNNGNRTNDDNNDDDSNDKGKGKGDHGEKGAAVTASSSRTITEGSASMLVPADEETSVFYNPVQVQNRDLSVLMIALAAERRAIRLALAEKQKEQKKASLANNAEDAKQKLQEYEQHLERNPIEALKLVNAKDHGLCILDALAASGLRSVRYWKELAGAVKHVTINDLDAAAVERARDNLTLNGISDDVVISDTSSGGGGGSGNSSGCGTADPHPYGIRIVHGDAKAQLYHTGVLSAGLLSSAKRSVADRQPTSAAFWDVVDLDPYGSASPFLDGAVHAVSGRGGLLCITCTDMAALGGAHPETCFGRYGAVPIQRAGYLQEMAVRILLYAVATTAARYGRSAHPVLSVGMDFYVRVFVEIYESKAAVRDLSLRTGQVYQATQTPDFYVAPSAVLGGKKGNVFRAGRVPTPNTYDVPSGTTGANSEDSNGADAKPSSAGSFKVGGPMWLGPLHDAKVIEQALQRLRLKPQAANSDGQEYPAGFLKWLSTADRLTGLLLKCQEECSEVPLYYKLGDLAQTLHIANPPLLPLQAALMNAGYKCSGYHKEPTAIKTDAPPAALWDILRTWYHRHHSPAEQEQKLASTKKKKKGKTNNDDIGFAEAVLNRQTPNRVIEEVNFTVPQSLRKKQRAVAAAAASARGGGGGGSAGGKKKRVARFPLNPAPNWGPKPKATGHKRKEPSSPTPPRP